MLIRQTLLYLPAQILGPLFQFAAIIAWTYWLTPEGMGVFAIITATQELTYLVCMSWFSFYALRYFPEADTAGKRDRFFRAENFILLITSVFITLAALAYFALFSDAPLSPEFLGIVLVYMLSRALSVHFAERARAGHKILAYSLLQIIGPVFGLGLGIAAAEYVSATPLSVFAGYAIAQSAALVVTVPMMGSALAFALPSGQMMRRSVRYGFPLLMAGAMVWVSMNGIRFVVEFERGAAAVGLIMVGLGLGQRGAAFAAMFVTAAAFPLAVKRAREEGESGGLAQLRDSGALLFAVLLPTLGGIVVLNTHLVEVLVAPAFQAMTIAILPFAIATGALRNFRTHFTDQTFLLFERSGMIVVIDGVDAAFSLVFCWLGLRYGGLEGAVAGLMVGAFAGVVLSLILSMANYALQLPLGHMLRILIATLAMVLMLKFVSFQGGGFLVIGEILIGICVYVLVMALLYPKIVNEGWQLLRARAAI